MADDTKHLVGFVHVPIDFFRRISDAALEKTYKVASIYNDGFERSNDIFRNMNLKELREFLINDPDFIAWFANDDKAEWIKIVDSKLSTDFDNSGYISDVRGFRELEFHFDYYRLKEPTQPQNQQESNK